MKVMIARKTNEEPIASYARINTPKRRAISGEEWVEIP